jgi:hypothetical protein
MFTITKRMLLTIIKRFPFENLVIPSRFATDREQDVPAFIEALTNALRMALLESAPGHVSPRKLVEPASYLAYEPSTPTPTSTLMSKMIKPEEENISTQSTPFMLRLRAAQESEDKQSKQRMKTEATEMEVKSEHDTLKDAQIGAEALTSHKASEEEQMRNIIGDDSLTKAEQGIVEAQQIPFHTSSRSLVPDVPGDKVEIKDSFDSGIIHQSPHLTQDSTSSKPIDLESVDNPMELRRAVLRNLALAGFPIHRSSNMILADESSTSSILPPPPDLPFYSRLKPISPARRTLMKDLMEETRRTLHYDPYALVDLAKECNLGLPMIYVNAVYQPYENDLEMEPELFQEESYDCTGWAVLDTAADCCYVCCDAIDISLAREKRYGGYFTIQYVFYLTNKLTIFSDSLGWKV